MGRFPTGNLPIALCRERPSVKLSLLTAIASVCCLMRTPTGSKGMPTRRRRPGVFQEDDGL